MKFFNDSIIDFTVSISRHYYCFFDLTSLNTIVFKIKLKEIEESNHCIDFTYSISSFKNISNLIKSILLEIENYYDYNGVILNNVSVTMEDGYKQLINLSFVLNCNG